MEYKIGQIYFWRSTEDLFGKAIDYYNKKTFGSSDTTHVGIICDIRDDAVLIAEAGNKGFLVDGNWYDKKWLDKQVKNKVVHIGEIKQNMKNVYSNCKQYENIAYGWLDIIAVGFSMLTGFKLGLTGKNKLICSEAVSRVIYDSTKSVNIAKEFNVPYDQVTPQMIFLSKYVNIL